MALLIEREGPGGVPLGYHRVACITHLVNGSTTIEVAGYVRKAKREEEARALAKGEPMDVLVCGERFELPYDPRMGPEEAYAWLKSQPGWEGASDDVEAVGTGAQPGGEAR